MLPPPTQVEIWAVEGLPEIGEGAALARLVSEGTQKHGRPLADGDVLVVAQKVISKMEGRLVDLGSIVASELAASIAREHGKDARQVEVILRESRRIVRMDAGIIVSETHHGLVCANAGVDSSNVPQGWVALLPADADASARRLAEEVAEVAGCRVGVIVSDTFGRPWREGLTNVAIGVAGLAPLIDYRGQRDKEGHLLTATIIAVADELAAAAELVMGKTSGRPVAVIRGMKPGSAEGSSAELIRPREKDLFR